MDVYVVNEALRKNGSLVYERKKVVDLYSPMLSCAGAGRLVGPVLYLAQLRG